MQVLIWGVEVIEVKDQEWCQRTSNFTSIWWRLEGKSKQWRSNIAWGDSLLHLPNKGANRAPNSIVLEKRQICRYCRKSQSCYHVSLSPSPVAVKSSPPVSVWSKLKACKPSFGSISCVSQGPHPRARAQLAHVCLVWVLGKDWIGMLSCY